MSEVNVRWIVEEDGTRRLQFAARKRYFGSGSRKYWEWEDVKEVPASEEYNSDED